jgi:hypothetical protein
MGQYAIEARSLSLLGGVASHNFWVLRDDKGNAVAELHGLATDRQTRQAVPIGTDAERHSLRGWHFIHDAQYARDFGSRQTNASYIQDGQTAVTVMTGSREEILERWKVAARTGVDLLNRTDRDYPNFGVGRQAGFDGAYNFRVNDSTVNSNSAYRTFGTLMVGGSNVPVFDGPLQPGVNNQVLPSNTILNLQYDRPQFRQGALPSDQNGVAVAVAQVPEPTLQGHPRHGQALQALANGENIPAGTMPQDRIDRIATNMALYSQFPQLSDDHHAQSAQPLAQIGSAVLSNDQTRLFLSDAADLRTHISPNVVAVSMGKLLEPPQTELVQRFQQSEPLAKTLPPSPSQQIVADEPQKASMVLG